MVETVLKNMETNLLGFLEILPKTPATLKYKETYLEQLKYVNILLNNTNYSLEELLAKIQETINQLVLISKKRTGVFQNAGKFLGIVREEIIKKVPNETRQKKFLNLLSNLTLTYNNAKAYSKLTTKLFDQFAIELQNTRLIPPVKEEFEDILKNLKTHLRQTKVYEKEKEILFEIKELEKDKIQSEQLILCIITKYLAFIINSEEDIKELRIISSNKGYVSRVTNYFYESWYENFSREERFKEAVNRSDIILTNSYLNYMTTEK